MPRIPSHSSLSALSKGSYLLDLYLDAGARLSIGRLGEHNLKKGHYIYAGSAMGPGGLKSRLGHHLSVSPKPHWHVDYLKKVCRIRRIWFLEGPENKEHHWSEFLSGLPGATIPVPGFGSSDCTCPTHLVYFPRNPDQWIRAMGKNLGHPILRLHH